jgi:hypothetical protein|tara:strand:- start:907 stop:2796 length:1890 start_codon:yes stop_codon:yes gene_type:complete
MRRNNGIIGVKQSTNLYVATGTFDLFDCYNARINNKWPKTKYLNSISPNSGNHLEGQPITFTINTDGYENQDALYYSIVSQSSGGLPTSSFFTDSTLTGQFYLNSSGVGSFTKTLVRNNTNDTASYKLQIREQSVSGPILGESGTFSMPQPSYTLTPSTSTPNEGTTVTMTLAGTDTYTGTHYYTLTGTAANATDIFSNLTGSFSFNGSSGTFFLSIRDDLTTEGNETFNIYARANSTSGPIVASSSVTIQDTSLTPVATITPSTTSVNEGQTVTFSISMTNFTSGTLDWITTRSSDMESTDISPSSGTVSISGSTGSIVITADADGYTESGQTESFTISLKSPEDDSVIGTSATVTINDTSTGSTEPTTIADLRDSVEMAKISQAIVGGRTNYKLTTSPHNITYGSNATYIPDGGGDMYDSGNYTICVTSNVSGDFGSSGTGGSQPVSYANTTSTTPSGSAAAVSDYKYVAGGWTTNTNLNSHGALIVAATTGNSGSQYCGFAKGGNSGADGQGTKSQVDLYNNATVNGFQVYASYMMITGAGDPSTCDLYILLGHSEWGTTFGSITKYNNTSTGVQNDGMWSDGTGQNNVLAIATLAARTSGNAPVQSEMQGIVDDIIADIKAEFGY